MAYFPHAFQKMLVAHKFITTADKSTAALKAGELAVVDASTNLSVALSTGSLTYALHPMVYLAQGSFHSTDKLGPFHGGYQESVKSKGINPKYISAFYVTEPSEPVQDIVHVTNALGSVCEIACDTTYRLRLDVKGSPALRFLTHNAYLTLDAYSGCCDSSNSNVDPNVVFLGWADQIVNSPIMSQFISAKVWNKVAAAAPPTATATAASSLTVSSATGIAAGQRVVFTPTTATSATGSTINGNLFTVGTATNTIFSVGQVLTGTGVAVGTVITKLISGGGGTGSTFEVSISQSVTSTTISSTSPVTAYVKGSYTTGTSIPLVVALTLTTPEDGTNISAFTTTSITPEFYSNITSANYTAVTGASAVNKVSSFIELIGAYTDTVFGNCSFSPIDHVEYQPVEIYASVVDSEGLPCVSSCFTVSEKQQAIQGRGFGETLVRELILSKRYMQEPWQQDPRMREVLDDQTFNELTRSTKYYTYHILHSVPRKSNPSGTMDNDQYLIKIVTEDRDSDFEDSMKELLTTANNYDVTFKVLA